MANSGMTSGNSDLGCDLPPSLSMDPRSDEDDIFELIDALDPEEVAFEDALTLDNALMLDQALPAPRPASVANNERRMNVRAYNYWATLLKQRPFPSVMDLDPTALTPFRDHSLLLDFSDEPKHPVLRYIGKNLREECDLQSLQSRPEYIPDRSLISRLTDHYLEIMANRAPIGFEAEFASPRGVQIMYRGILLPLSDDNNSINFMYGVINWREVMADGASAPVRPVTEDADSLDILELTTNLANPQTLPEAVEAEAAPPQALEDRDSDALELTAFDMALIHADTAFAEQEAASQQADFPAPVFPAEDILRLDSPIAEDILQLDSRLDPDIAPLELRHPVTDPTPELPAPDLAPLEIGEQEAMSPGFDATPFHHLNDLLALARAQADLAQSAHTRSRLALYNALGRAYDLALAAENAPEAFALVLEAAGLTVQARAPFTPVVKLVFGADYDKGRLTEFAAALNLARRQNLPVGSFAGLIDMTPGGLKALVQSERALRAHERGDTRLSHVEAAKIILREQTPRFTVPGVPPGDDEFVVLLARRTPHGLDILEPLSPSETTLASLLRTAVPDAPDAF